MNKLFSRLAPAVALCLPLLATAQPGRTDPADARASAAALRYRSAFADYKPWHEIQPGNWRAVNDGVRPAPKDGGHTGHAAPAPAGSSAPAPSTAPSMPVMPGPGGHRMNGGKP